MDKMYQQKGVAHLLPVLAVGIVTLFIVSSLIPITRSFNDGRSQVEGVYLAKDDESSSGSPNSDSSGNGSSDSNSDADSDEDSSGSSNETVVKERDEDLRVETKTTPQRIKSEIRDGNLRVKFEVKENKVEIETKIKSNSDEVELEDEAEDQALSEVETELEDEDIKIATAPGQVALVHKRVGALSNFPLSVNPLTKELTVTTPVGSKVVAVLPQQAIDNMLASNVMDFVVGERVDNELASIPSLVKLEEKDGVLIYRVKGTKTYRLLGFIPIKTAVEALVSAENGTVMETTQSLLGRILNRIAP